MNGVVLGEVHGKSEGKIFQDNIGPPGILCNRVPLYIFDNKNLNFYEIPNHTI